MEMVLLGILMVLGLYVEMSYFTYVEHLLELSLLVKMRHPDVGGSSGVLGSLSETWSPGGGEHEIL